MNTIGNIAATVVKACDGKIPDAEAFFLDVYAHAVTEISGMMDLSENQLMEADGIVRRESKGFAKDLGEMVMWMGFNFVGTGTQTRAVDEAFASFCERLESDICAAVLKEAHGT